MAHQDTIHEPIEHLSKHLVPRQLVLADIHPPLLAPLLAVHLGALPAPVLVAHGLLEARARGSGRDELGVLVQRWPAERAFEEPDGGEDETRADLHKGRDGRAGGLEGVFLDYLEIAEPDLVVEDGEEENVVDEWFEAAGRLGHGEDLE